MNLFHLKSGLVSIIVPTVSRNKFQSLKTFFKKRYLLKNLLSDVKKNVLCDFELIVICNSSKDRNLIELIKSHPVITRWSINSQNIGVPRSWNQGANLALGEYLCFANDDAEIGPGSIEKMVSWFSNPEIGEVGPKGGRWFRKEPGEYVGKKKFSEADQISGWLFMIPTKIYYEIGGFDNYYSPAFMEEIDLSFAVRNAGYKCIVDPSINAKHHHISGASSTEKPLSAMGEKIFRRELTSRNRSYFEKKWEKFWK